MVQSLYPEHNAQFTFFSGLSNIAHKEEVEWRAHYFKSFLMRPRPNNEEHFKALVKHISAKREMPTVKLPNDVFLFLMPNCLLASQLGLVRRDDDSPVLHCVLMSKFSTNQAQNKKLVDRKSLFKNYGSATGWESLFDDSDFSDDEEDMNNKTQLAKKLSSLFREQRNVQNKFAAMSIVDADLNFSQCSCRKLSAVKVHCQRRREADVARVLSACHSSSHSGQKGGVVSATQVSHQRPKQKMSKRTKSMPSFSPHGSSDSDSDVENGKRVSHRHKEKLSLLNSTKTVEEELSEEELTTEQMEDIIFLRKPAFTTASSLRPKPTGHAQGQNTIPSIPKHSRSKDSHSQSVPDLHKSSSEHLFNAKPKIIPTEPVEQILPKPKTIIAEPKIIPVEPVVSDSKGTDEKVHGSTPLKPELSSNKGIESSAYNFVPKSILKNSVVPVIPLSKEPVTHEVSGSQTVQPPEEVEDFGDVDMRIPMQGPVTLHPIFLSERHLPFLEPSPPKTQQQQLSPNFSFGSWLAPGEIQEASLYHNSFSNMGPSSPTTPPSPIDSPISPPTDSPASPPSSPAVMDTESPASPPQSLFQERCRSSPIAIPTTRIVHNVSPEVRFVHRLPSPMLPSSSESKERIDSANDMKNFLNSGFESDLDSSYEDER
ncbi:hypothetical protein Btru_052691 [Bulinus truncatus]|nr:hypothetical protein Btru_052691 [Bulinus truncatus]